MISYAHDDCVIIFAAGNEGEDGSYLWVMN